MIPNRCHHRHVANGRPWVCVAPKGHAQGAHYYRAEPRVPGVQK